MKRFKAGSWGAEGYDKFLEENYGDDAVFLSVNAYRKLSQEIATTRGRIDHAYYAGSGIPYISETPKPVFEREKF
jgi:hypothetical protein